MFSPWRNPSPPSRNEKEEPWPSVSLKPENFVPGLVIGFLLGMFLDFSRQNLAQKLSSATGKLQRPISEGGDEELKMVLVVRQDLRMGAGKIASQCAHAATGMYADIMRRLCLGTSIHRSLLRQWEQCGQPKIVLSCKNQQEMNKLKEAADRVGLPTFIVADAGRTQVLAGSKTVLAIGPGLQSLSCPMIVSHQEPRKEGTSGFDYWKIAPVVIVLPRVNFNGGGGAARKFQ